MNTDIIYSLKERLQSSLPGQDAQYKMAHAVRRRTAPPPADARRAGVMALLYPKANDWHLVFIERPHHPEDRHSGQISFPGGKEEKEDMDLSVTALREVKEEIGVASEDIQLLGALTELYIPVSNFLVQPFVGFSDKPLVFQPQPEEVQAIVEAPFRTFFQPEAKQNMDLTLSSKIVLREVPYFGINDKVIWGATAMMLSELVEVGKEANVLNY
jgi:8-oxo-dGTP pyrophosphatase MutT (NUDIX family)